MGNSPTLRFLSYVRPHLWLVAGGSVMGILKFVLPLAFPLAFKYVFDVLLVPQPRLERVNALIDRWCRRARCIRSVSRRPRRANSPR